MMTDALLVVAVLLCSLLLGSARDCGIRPHSRIVGGKEAPKNGWPWQVMLRTRSYRDYQFCGGSLIAPQWVITAAQCVKTKTAGSIYVRLGAHYRTSGRIGTEQDVGVETIINHEMYNRPMKYSNDIALLKLNKPAQLGRGVGLVCLPDYSHTLPVDNSDKKCWITGWGTLYSGGSSSNALMEATVPLVGKQRCQRSYPNNIDDTMLCAGLDQGGVDACQGDSGGPLVCEYKGKWHLEGATSWGHGCATAWKYGVYANIRKLGWWIGQKTGIDTGALPPPPPDPKCLDKSSRAAKCPNWAKYGYCYRASYWMRSNCAKTCGWCR